MFILSFQEKIWNEKLLQYLCECATHLTFRIALNGMQKKIQKRSFESSPFWEKMRESLVMDFTDTVYFGSEFNEPNRILVYKIDLSLIHIWNTCPDYGTATSYLAANDSTGTANKRMRFDVTDWVSGIAGGGSNFGLMLKNQIEASSSYTEFYGSRTGSTSYRPKLTVTYTEDKPTTASGVTASKSTYNVGENISVTWNDITANSLSHIEYRVAKYDDSGTLLDDYYVPYTRLTSAKSTGTAVICLLYTSRCV